MGFQLISGAEYATRDPAWVYPDQLPPMGNVAHDTAILQGTVGELNPIASIILPTQSGGLVPGMLNDYYNRVWVLPAFIRVRNPVLGFPQPYYLWNAYFGPNTLTTRTDTGTTGLINDATVGTEFKRLEIKGFGVQVTADAPQRVSAIYDFTFTVGHGVLEFVATRATIMADRPSAPAVINYQWVTDILKAWDGSEQRVTIRPDPRMSVDYDIQLSDEAAVRRIKAKLFSDLVTPVIVPLWHEETPVAPVDPGATSLTGDFSLLDLLPGDTFYIEDKVLEASELLQVDTISDTEITLTTATSLEYLKPIIVPTVEIQTQDNAGVGRLQRNWGHFQLSGDSPVMNPLRGKGASITLYKDRPLLDLGPSAGSEVQDTFTQDYERIDYGNIFQVEFSKEFPNIGKPREFYIGSKEELQYWKLFLDTVKGMRNTFYAPTYTPDLVVANQPLPGSQSLDVYNEDFDFGSTWHLSQSNQNLMFVNALGERLPYEVSNVVDNGDGTSTISVATPFPSSEDGSTIVRIELMPLCRLGSDKVTFTHDVDDATVKLTIMTIEE